MGGLSLSLYDIPSDALSAGRMATISSSSRQRVCLMVVPSSILSSFAGFINIEAEAQKELLVHISADSEEGE